MIAILLSILGIVGSVFALIQTIKSFILTKDIQDTANKTNLLQTIIDAKNTDITRDEEKVKETGDAYETSKSNYDTNNKPK